MPGWVFITDEEAKSRDPSNYGYDQSHHTQTGMQASRPDRIKGRSQRGAAAKYEVPVELHVPVPESSIIQPIAREEGYGQMSQNVATRGRVQDIRQPYHHVKQASGSGRSVGSSAADSGYDGGHEVESNRDIRNNGRRDEIERHKPNFPQKQFDNPAYDSEVSTDDILEQHKALAAKMLQQKVSQNERTNNYYDREMLPENTYNRYGKDICDSGRGVNIQYQGGHRTDSQSDQMGESFI